MVAVIERASPADRAFLAMDAGGVPQQVGAVLLLAPAADLDVPAAERLIAERITAIPRLRQRLVRVPFGCGGPVWIDDADFDVTRHVRTVACPAPGDERALLEVAESLTAERLPLTAPPWSAVFVTGVLGDGVALVVVLHHVLADGIGGLGVLLDLVDNAASAPPAGGFPRTPPTRGQLAADALRRRVRSLRRVRQGWRQLRAAMSAGGGLRPPRATACSLVRRTGPLRRLAVVRADIAPLAEVAHRHGATTNDALLVAVAGAARRVLLARGESIDRVAVAVPVSGRSAGGRALGNMVSPLLVAVPAAGGIPRRLRRVAADVAAGKPAARGPAPIAVLGWAFRPLAAAGGYHWYMNHQRRMHTLVSHVRGPAAPVAFAGVPVRSVIPISLADNGNLTVYFVALSYADELTVTIVAEPEHVPDLRLLTAALRTELSLIAELAPHRPPRPGAGSSVRLTS